MLGRIYSCIGVNVGWVKITYSVQVHFDKRNTSLNELVWLAGLHLANFVQLGTIKEQNKSKQSGFSYTDSHCIVGFCLFMAFVHHQPTTFCHCLPKSEATSFQALRPTTPNMDTSPGNPTTTSPTTPVSSLLYLKTVLCPWELKVRPSQQHAYNCAPEAILTCLFSLQVNLFFLIQKWWLRGFSEEINSGQILRGPIWCLPSWPNTSPTSFSRQTTMLRGASPRL